MSSNKVALITGGSKGIGKAITLDLASKGYNVIINYKSDDISANKTLDDVMKFNVKASLYRCDISNEDNCIKMVDDIINEYGRIDVLVNNAGISLDAAFEDKNANDFNKILSVNLIAPFVLSKAVGKYMMDNHYGKIINISSTNGIDTYYPCSIDYDASKAALINMTHNLAEVFKPYINVNVVCPGWVDTDMNKEIDSSFKDVEINKIKLGRFAQPSEIAKVVSFLASDDASYVNDAVIRVDGGEK